MSDKTEEFKQKLIEDLIAARRSILDATVALPAECLEQVFLGDWSVKDLLAHLIGWDYTNLQAIKEILSGQYPSFLRFYNKDWRSYNARLVREYREELLTELIASAGESQRQLVDYLASIPAGQLLNCKARSERGRTVTVRNLLKAEASDERVHAEQILRFQVNKE